MIEHVSYHVTLQCEKKLIYAHTYVVITFTVDVKQKKKDEREEEALLFFFFLFSTVFFLSFWRGTD